MVCVPQIKFFFFIYLCLHFFPLPTLIFSSSISFISLHSNIHDFFVFFKTEQEKIDRLNVLDRLLQEQSFKVSSFREDKVRKKHIEGSCS